MVHFADFDYLERVRVHLERHKHHVVTVSFLFIIPVPLLDDIVPDVDELLRLDHLGLVLVRWQIDASETFVTLSRWVMHDNEALLANLTVCLGHVDNGFAKLELVRLNAILVFKMLADFLSIQLRAFFEGFIHIVVVLNAHMKTVSASDCVVMLHNGKLVRHLVEGLLYLRPRVGVLSLADEIARKELRIGVIQVTVELDLVLEVGPRGIVAGPEVVAFGCC